MAAEVSYLVGRLHRTAGNDSDCDGSTAPMTRDLLSGSFKLGESKELDLDLQVPTGWEKRLDLKSGKIYIQRSNSPISISSNNNQPLVEVEDDKKALNLFDESLLDLKLLSSWSHNYQSVCTLDKVKFALERAEKESARKRTSSSFPSSSIEDDTDIFSVAQVAAGCPSCLLYVLISMNNPKCPRCNSVVPVPVARTKRPRIDLNISIL